MRLLLVVNSSASSVTARGRVVIHKALSADHDVDIAETSRRGHATRLAQGAAADGYDVVVCLGGDGTLNETANGLVGTDTALAVLPGGSTNVFARSIGLPNDPLEATGMLVEALTAQRIAPVGLGSVNDRYFLFHVGIGFDAAVVEQVERRSGLKRYAGHPLFVYSAFSTWFRHYDRSSPRFAVHHADGKVVDDAYFAIVLNTNPYTYIGNRPFNVAPEATLDRGLATVTIRTLSFVPFLGIVASALGSGERFRRHRLVDYRTDVADMKVTGHGPVPYQLDGDYVGTTDTLAFHHEPRAMRMVLPVP